MFRGMVFNVIAMNCDDHSKNFSFLLKQGGKWELSPAYDLCHAYRPGSEWVSQHALSLNGKRKKITKADLLVIGESIRCKKASELSKRSVSLRVRVKKNQSVRSSLSLSTLTPILYPEPRSNRQVRRGGHWCLRPARLPIIRTASS
jgi:hypothetical protein